MTSNDTRAGAELCQAQVKVGYPTRNIVSPTLATFFRWEIYWLGISRDHHGKSSIISIYLQLKGRVIQTAAGNTSELFKIMNGKLET